MPIRIPAKVAIKAPTNSAISRRSVLFGTTSARLAAATTPLKAQTDINPACPRLSSPDIPTTRLSDNAMMIYEQIGIS